MQVTLIIEGPLFRLRPNTKSLSEQPGTINHINHFIQINQLPIMSIDIQVIYVPIRHSADQGTNIRMRLRCSFRLWSFGYVLNDDLRLTQPIRAAHPFDEIPLYTCREPSTNQLLFMQNKPNFRKSQMNANLYNTTDYERKRDWTLGQNKPNSNPIKPNFHKAKMNVKSLIIPIQDINCR